MTTLDRFGPVDFVVVEFPDARLGLAGFSGLLRLVDQAAVRVLDLEFVTVTDGRPRVVPIGELGEDLTAFAGASSGLLDPQDLDLVAASLRPGGVAAVLIYEELSMLTVLDAWKDGGARVIAEGPISLDELAAALDTTEPAP
ncbi:DUF6325 family protein (plasmid) [Rhodococcus aetherivorans]|uniref:DUF6325 family protein n=1 Tax=Rhodococcus aetherivorans TaxID=191292 RepID=UPI0002D229EC|nr:DUF6325 family protein [Rhodococcus aetherivorans]MDV6296536.1 DUF6325 family protein [Rhodococcus aetherivorans]CCW14424.1 hypothetical protein EBESD8_49930 [Rhodococcus aetherivorans]